MKKTETEKKKVLDQVRRSLDAEFEDVRLVSKSQAGQVIHSVPRVLYLISGERDAEYFSLNGEMKRETVNPGTIYYSAFNGYLQIQNIKGVPSQGISLSFYSDFIRYMLVDFDGENTPPTNRDIILHSNLSLPSPGFKLLEVLNEMAETSDCVSEARNILASLLRISIDTIERGDDKAMKRFNPSYEIWHRINSYLRSHFNEDISRKKVAATFNISTSHLSHIFKQYSKKNFTETLEDARLEHAAMVLRQTDLSVKEISDQCNFKYTSYFIKRFKIKFGSTPMSYRSRSES